MNTNGWLTENITTDALQTTTDGKYEYQLELINSLQRNSSARIYLKEVSTAKETRIPIDLPVNEIKVLFIKKNYYWITLEPTPRTDTYIMHTTKEFPLPGEKYEINVRKGEAIRGE